jgi:hypothetical protein
MKPLPPLVHPAFDRAETIVHLFAVSGKPRFGNIIV